MEGLAGDEVGGAAVEVGTAIGDGVGGIAGSAHNETSEVNVGVDVDVRYR